MPQNPAASFPPRKARPTVPRPDILLRFRGGSPATPARDSSITFPFSRHVFARSAVPTRSHTPANMHVGFQVQLGPSDSREFIFHRNLDFFRIDNGRSSNALKRCNVDESSISVRLRQEFQKDELIWSLAEVLMLNGGGYRSEI